MEFYLHEGPQDQTRTIRTISSKSKNGSSVCGVDFKDDEITEERGCCEEWNAFHGHMKVVLARTNALNVSRICDLKATNFWLL